MYNISEGLKDAVRRKNISAVRSRFFTLIARNPSGREISAYVDYCLSNGLSENEFYMPDSSETFKNEKKEWTQAYWIELGSEMQIKFSKKHIDHMIEVADYLFPERSQSNSQDYAKKKSEDSLHYSEKKSVYSSKREKTPSTGSLIAVGVAAVAVLLAIWFISK